MTSIFGISPLDQNMSDLKARCSIDLSYPYHGETAALDRLAALRSFVDAEGCVAEGYLLAPLQRR